MNRKMEETFFQNYLEFFHLAETRRRWNIQTSIPWEEAKPEASETIADIIETFSWVEAFLPDYTSSILQCVRRSRGRAWFSANWGYEESKHSLTLEHWLLRTGKRKEGEINDNYDALSVREWRRRNFNAVADAPNVIPTARNDTPMPTEYATRSATARGVVCVAATPNTAARTGPRHGDQPKPNAAPMIGALAHPNRRVAWNRFSG